MRKTLKLEVCMLPTGKNKNKIRIARTFEGHFPGVVFHIFLGTLEATWQEWINRIEWLAEKIKAKLREYVTLARPASGTEARIILLLIANIAMITWMVNNNMILAQFSYNYAHGEEDSADSVPLDNSGKTNLQAITKFDGEKEKKDDYTEENKQLAKKLDEIISSDEERCQKDKEKERCTELCLKNEEEIIARMKEEERQAWMKYIASKPKIAPHISCAEANDGHPSYSDTKGKHMDEDCCPDPDEWPKPGCVYDARGLALMLKGPAGKKK
jgi:hypothetical protein